MNKAVETKEGKNYGGGVVGHSTSKISGVASSFDMLLTLTKNHDSIKRLLKKDRLNQDSRWADG